MYSIINFYSMFKFWLNFIRNHRYLQTLNTIAAEKNSTIVFPIPMEFLKGKN